MCLSLGGAHPQDRGDNTQVMRSKQIEGGLDVIRPRLARANVLARVCREHGEATPSTASLLIMMVVGGWEERRRGRLPVWGGGVDGEEVVVEKELPKMKAGRRGSGQR